MLSTVFELLGSVVLVFIASLLFINALEWLGNRLKLSSSFVGAILSPIFTSLPELIVILIAIFSNVSTAGEGIGIGTIFGEPFMASSLSYGLVGIAVIIGFFARKRSGINLVVDKTLTIPYIFIVVLFPFTLIPGFIHQTWLRYFFGALFFGFFLFYMRLMYRRRATEEVEEAEELTLAKWVFKSPSQQMIALGLQIAAAVVMLYFGSLYLVSSVTDIAQEIHINPMGLAIIVVPAATAIPETITALLWGYRGKDTLSIGSLVGEKILYSSFYPALGLLLTPWVLDIHAVFSVIVTTIISLIMFYYISKQRLPWYVLFFGLAFFIAYIVLIFGFRV